MTTSIDYPAQAREFAQWLVNFQGKGRRLFKTPTTIKGNCPKPGHDDKHPSFGFDVEKDAYACSCSSGKGSELRDALGWKSANGNGSGAAFSKPVSIKPPPSREPDEVYKYANGNRKLKWRVPEKHVSWRHESGAWGMKGEPGLYRLDEALKTEGVIHVSESESDVDALWELGMAATSTHAGAAAPWKEAPVELAGRQLVVWEHQDEPGRKYAAAMMEAAKRAGVDVAIARSREPHKDVRDWIVAGAGREELLAVADAALLDFPLAESATELLKADLPPPEYVIHPIAIRSNLTLIQGEPKAGKSIVTLYAAASTALGIWKAGRWGVPRPFRTLYITWEDGRRRIQKRLRQFLSGLGTPLVNTITEIPNLSIYSKSRGPFKAPRIRLEEPAGRALLKKIILGHKAEIVFLDTLSHMKAVDENQVEKMQPVMDALTDIVEETGCAIVLNHHTGKEGKPGGRSTTYKSRGSSCIPAAADVILHLGDRGKTNMTPCQTISREDDNDAFVLEYLPEGDEIVRFQLVDEPDDEASDEDKYRNQKLAIEALAKICYTQAWGATINDVVKETKLPRTTVQRVLRRLADEGLIQRQKVQTKNGEAWAYAPMSHVFAPK